MSANEQRARGMWGEDRRPGRARRAGLKWGGILVLATVLGSMVGFPLSVEAAGLTGCPTLKPGMSGPCVATLQRYLNDAGAAKPPLVVDSSYGELTKHAVTNWQMSHHPPLAVDGIAGAQTQASLINALSVATPRLAPAPAPNTSEKLRDDQARQMLQAAGIPVKSTNMCTDRNRIGCTSFEQIRRATITGVIAFKQASGCPVTVTGGTERGHSTDGTATHGNGYKIDISKAKDDCVTKYIHSSYRHIKNRRDGAPQWVSPAGDIYADEASKGHWDITYR